MKTPKYIVFWTWGMYRRVNTKKSGHRAMKAWKRWYERQGWTVYGGAQAGQMIAIKGNEKHAICLRAPSYRV